MNVLSFDLGASSGRGILARFDGTKITLEEIHRFPHNFSILNGHAYWNILSLMDEMKEGMRRCKEPLSGVGFDTWGVDCGLLDKEGNLLGLPLSYRDAALDEENMNRVLAALAGASEVSPEAVQQGEKIAFEQTGIASLPYNTIYKLCYMKEAMAGQLEAADSLLFMPNLIEYLFTGEKHSEYSITSTSQLYNMKEKKWALDMMKKLGLRQELFQTVDVTWDCSARMWHRRQDRHLFISFRYRDTIQHVLWRLSLPGKKSFPFCPVVHGHCWGYLRRKCWKVTIL